MTIGEGTRQDRGKEKLKEKKGGKKKIHPQKRETQEEGLDYKTKDGVKNDRRGEKEKKGSSESYEENETAGIIHAGGPSPGLTGKKKYHY